MAPKPTLIVITPDVADRLKYTAMGGDVHRCAAEVLDRWRRHRGDEPRPNNAVTHMAEGTAEDAPPLTAFTETLVVPVEEETAEALERHRPRSMSATEYGGFLLHRWSDWHEVQRRVPPLSDMNGATE